jgi:outer membrane protein, heavy metal efflux system
MPSKAMKPTDAGTDRYSPVSHRATMPPTIANGTLERTSNAWRTEPNVVNRMTKINPSDSVVQGAKRRLRPVLMTAAITAFGLIPLLFATGPGSEIQRPLAIVVIGGLITATAPTRKWSRATFRSWRMSKERGCPTAVGDRGMWKPRSRSLWLAIAVAVHAIPSSAADRATPPDLPPTEQARQAIEQDPAVVEARRALSGAGYGAAALRASPYEWTTRISAQRRHYDGNGISNEWSAALERTIRIGGKAAIDAQLGDTEIAIGRARVGEAQHEAARTLVDLWLDRMAASRLRQLWSEQLSFAETSLQAVQTRLRAGDASTLELNVARGDLTEVQRQLSASTTAEAKARSKLVVRFPSLKSETGSLSEPMALELPEHQWRERILGESEALRIAKGLRTKAELTAARAKAERIPDPTVGVYTASEAFRNERIVGISLSIPFSGTYRSQRMQQALQEAEAAQARVDRQQRDLESAIVEAFAEATGGLERRRLASQGLATTRETARLTQRAYALGEADLQTLLLARRQALDASTAAEQARVETLRWHYRLLVDAHLIWGLAEE